MAKIIDPPSLTGRAHPVSVQDAVESGWSVIAANERTARRLRREWGEERLATKSSGPWQPAQILSWRAWTQEIWHRLVMAGETRLVLLQEAQEDLLWKGIVNSDRTLANHATDVRSSAAERATRDAIATLAGEAANRVWASGAEGRFRHLANHGDALVFLRWFELFERRCKQEGWIARGRLEGVLSGLVKAGQAQLVTSPSLGLFLVGSEDLTRTASALVQALKQSGVSISEMVTSGTPAAQRMLVRAEDEVQELLGCARWLRAALQERPEARFAIVVPHLDQERTEIDRVFRAVVSPALSFVGAKPGTEPWEFSQAVPVAKTLMGSVALKLLCWAVHPLSIEQIGHMLLAETFGGDEERAVRAELDARELRHELRLRKEVSLEDLTRAVHRSTRASQLSELRATLREMTETAKAMRGEKQYGDWAQHMAKFLTAARWCEKDRAEDVGAQLAKRWADALDALASLELVQPGKVTLDDALGDLKRIAEQTFFIATQNNARVEVITPKEASSEHFDAVWFLRGGDRVWPERPAPQPLLPISLQREFSMPGVDVDKDRAAGRETTRRVVESADTVVCSYSQHWRDGQQKAAPVVTELLEVGEAEIGEVATLDAVASRTVTEWIEDVDEVGPLPDQVLSGGARLLELQAACGFRAFAEGRLQARPLRNGVFGLDALERGNAIHRALELFWTEVESQDVLRSMNAEERSGVLQRAIAGALESFSRNAQTLWDRAYIAMVETRLHALLQDWLRVELARELPFRVKSSEEKLEDVHVGPLRLNLRIDRVDQTDRGEVLIDYKTGITHSNPRGWTGDRMDAPQLPLYAVLRQSAAQDRNADQLEAVAFGRVVAGGEMQLHGIEGSSGTLPKAETVGTENLQSRIAAWEEVLQQLAKQYAQADARVRPKSFPGTCKHCSQRLLCRVDAAALAETLETGAEESEEEVECG